MVQLSKFECAVRQLETAGEIYLRGGDPVSIVTLAAAAEEILGALVKASGKKSMLYQLLADDFFKDQAESHKDLVRLINGNKNALKHGNYVEESEFEFEPEEAVAWLIRALANLSCLDGVLSPTLLEVYIAIKTKLNAQQ